MSDSMRETKQIALTCSGCLFQKACPRNRSDKTACKLGQNQFAVLGVVSGVAYLATHGLTPPST